MCSFGESAVLFASSASEEVAAGDADDTEHAPSEASEVESMKASSGDTACTSLAAAVSRPSCALARSSFQPLVNKKPWSAAKTPEPRRPICAGGRCEGHRPLRSARIWRFVRITRRPRLAPTPKLP